MQESLIKAARYGKVSLSLFEYNNDELNEISKLLRIQKSIFFNKKYPRLISYLQLSQISNNHLINILLRYKLHYLAHEICKYMKFKNSLIHKIYIDWAKCIIESDKPDDIIVKTIQQRISSQKDSYCGHHHTQSS